MFCVGSVQRLKEIQLGFWFSSETGKTAGNGGQTRLGVSGQELRSCGAMRQSAACKGVNTEAEEPTALGAVTKQRLVKRQKTEKT
jgi:hypothetical protein